MKKQLLTLLAVFAFVQSGLQAMEGPVHIGGEPLPGDHLLDPMRDVIDPYRDHLQDHPGEEAMTPEERATWQAQQESGYGDSLSPEGQDGALEGGDALQHPEDSLIDDWVHIGSTDLLPGQQGATVAPEGGSNLPSLEPLVDPAANQARLQQLEISKNDAQKYVTDVENIAGEIGNFTSAAAHDKYDGLTMAIDTLIDYLQDPSVTDEQVRNSVTSSLQTANQLRYDFFKEYFPSEFSKFQKAKADLITALLAQKPDDFARSHEQYNKNVENIIKDAQNVYNKKALGLIGPKLDPIKAEWISPIIVDAEATLNVEIMAVARAHVRLLDDMFPDYTTQQRAQERLRVIANIGELVDPTSQAYKDFVRSLDASNFERPAEGQKVIGQTTLEYLEQIGQLKDRKANQQITQEQFNKEQADIVLNALTTFGPNTSEFNLIRKAAQSRGADRDLSANEPAATTDDEGSSTDDEDDEWDDEEAKAQERALAERQAAFEAAQTVQAKFDDVLNIWQNGENNLIDNWDQWTIYPERFKAQLEPLLADVNLLLVEPRLDPVQQATLQEIKEQIESTLTWINGLDVQPQQASAQQGSGNSLLDQIKSFNKNDLNSGSPQVPTAQQGSDPLAEALRKRNQAMSGQDDTNENLNQMREALSTVSTKKDADNLADIIRELLDDVNLTEQELVEVQAAEQRVGKLLTTFGEVERVAQLEAELAQLRAQQQQASQQPAQQPAPVQQQPTQITDGLIPPPPPGDAPILTGGGQRITPSAIPPAPPLPTVVTEGSAGAPPPPPPPPPPSGNSGPTLSLQEQIAASKLKAGNTGGSSAPAPKDTAGDMQAELAKRLAGGGGLKSNVGASPIADKPLAEQIGIITNDIANFNSADQAADIQAKLAPLVEQNKRGDIRDADLSNAITKLNDQFKNRSVYFEDEIRSLQRQQALANIGNKSGGSSSAQGSVDFGPRKTGGSKAPATSIEVDIAKAMEKPTTQLQLADLQRIADQETSADAIAQLQAAVNQIQPNGMLEKRQVSALKTKLGME